ncbi:hypothetical protein D9M72_486260 [compost metagenome]
MAGDFLSGDLQYVRQPNDGREDIAALGMQAGAGIRQVEAPGTSVDELLADGLLQSFQRHADGRLLQEQAVRGGGDAAFLDKHDESAQQIPVEIVGEAFEAVIGHGRGLLLISGVALAIRSTVVARRT